MEERRNNFGRIEGRIRTKKLNARVDLTAMVSVSFLLIVFFMLTSYMSRPQCMDLGMPEKYDEEERNGIICILEVSDDRDMTILLGENGKIVSNWGNFSSPKEEPKVFNGNTNDLTKELRAKSQHLLDIYGDPKKGLIVLIKPSKKSSYGDLVNALDKMAITRVPTYAVVDITPEDEKLLAEK
ncbi:biopolymer transporter ExbD [Flavobacterium amniphilum]|uniref:ExbD/TolR family protein n=1 Tax=Flavobacterium amniphilum TaxID=1834035 RepID=UPI00202A8A56|nr:biopolymer transporter ExbD [Flavobacterium amniphilum]MCL9804416.1 biopolymer transporter ExbD [Flavobacterium amniphilum]